MKEILPPKFVALEATRLCNLKCVMCHVHSDNADRTFTARYPAFFDMDKYRWIIEQLTPYSKGMSIWPQFQGEPLLAPHLYEMIKLAKASGFTVGFTTNGMLLTEPAVSTLIDLKLDSLCISVDGITKHTFESIRKGSDFDRIMRNIDTLLSMRKNKPSVSINAVRMASNAHEIQQLIDYWLGKVGQISVSSLWAEGDVKAKRCLPERFPCRDPWERMIVLTNGDVIPCCHPGFDMVMGNAYETPMMEIWNGKMYSHFRTLHSQRRWSEIPTCARCVTWMVTKGEVRRENDRVVELYPFHEVYYRIPSEQGLIATLVSNPRLIAKALRNPPRAFKYLVRRL